MRNNYRLMGPDNLIRLLQMHDTSLAYITEKRHLHRMKIYAGGKRESDVIKESLGKSILKSR